MAIDNRTVTTRTITTGTIEIPVSDGSTMSAYLARPVGDIDPVGVIVAHELFGVNPDIRAVVEEFAAAGHVTIAPEFYHRDAAPGHWLPRDDSGRDEGFRLLHAMTRDQAVEDVRATVDALEKDQGVTETALVGFSAGGHLAFLAATRLPLRRVAVLYGGWLASTDIPLSRPGPTLDLAGGITGRLLYLVGADDSLIGAQDVDRIDEALRTAGVDHEIVRYPGTAHAFFWPDTPAFDREARDDARRRLLAFVAG